MRDAVKIRYTFGKSVKNMSEETALKFIKVLKKTSFQQEDVFMTELAIGRTDLKNSKKIKAAIQDFKKSLKDFPFKDETYND